MTDVERPGRAVVRLGEDTVARLLCLPEGRRVVGGGADWERLAISVLVDGAGLPPRVEGAVPPELGGTAGLDVLVDGDGVPWVRWVWMPDRLDGPPPTCGYGQAEPCGRPPAGAFAARARLGVTGPVFPRPVAVVQCEEHWTKAPADWPESTPDAGP